MKITDVRTRSTRADGMAPLTAGDEVVVVRSARLRRFADEALRRAGLPRKDAALVADSLVEANLRGVDSHGVGRLFPAYIRKLQSGQVNPRPRLRVLRDRGATALLDGDDGMGQVVAAAAMDLAIRKARRAGVAAVGVRRSSHCGAAAYFAMRALPHGMIGIAMTSGTSNAMAPWGGTTPLLSNNPVAVAIPAGRRLPVVLDMAMSVVARGKIVLAAQAGQPIPPDWALTADGEPTTDPEAALAGLLRPIGDYKGAGLALVVGILTAILTGAAFGREIRGFYENLSDPHNTGHLMLALRVAHFMPLAAFRHRMDAVVDELKASRLAAGATAILLPGEPELLTVRRRRREGIPVPAGLAAELDGLAERLGTRARLGAPGHRKDGTHGRFDDRPQSR